MAGPLQDYLCTLLLRWCRVPSRSRVLIIRGSEVISLPRFSSSRDVDILDPANGTTTLTSSNGSFRLWNFSISWRKNSVRWKEIVREYFYYGWQISIKVAGNTACCIFLISLINFQMLWLVMTCLDMHRWMRLFLLLLVGGRECPVSNNPVLSWKIDIEVFWVQYRLVKYKVWIVCVGGFCLL